MGGECQYCLDNTDYHPTCSHPGCDTTIHADFGEPIPNMCDEHRNIWDDQ